MGGETQSPELLMEQLKQGSTSFGEEVVCSELGKRIFQVETVTGEKRLWEISLTGINVG
jgi:hypothetical protein